MAKKQNGKGALTVRMLLKGYTVPEIMAEMLLVYPGSGTTENSIYYWASKTPGVSLSQRNDKVDNGALAALQAKLGDAPVAAPAKPKELTTAELREQIRAEVAAEIEAELVAAKAKAKEARQARLIKKADRVA